MFWETFAKHSFEIIAALLGSGILGYLWSRWFGDGKPSVYDNSAYENQIRSLRDRIKQQDIDLQASNSIKDTWAAEKDGLHQKINLLVAELDDANQSRLGFISPEDHNRLKQQYDSELNILTNKYETLTAERDGLLSSVKNLEIKLKDVLAIKTDLEQTSKAGQDQIAEKQKHDDALLQAKETELNDLKSRLQLTVSKSQELESQLHKLKDAIAEKDKSIDHLIQSAQDADTHAKELDKHYNSLIASKDDELKFKTDQLSSASLVLQTQLTQKTEELSELNSFNQRLENKITELGSTILKSNETEQITDSKLNELQARIHQLEQENTSIKSETNVLKNKSGNLDDLSLAVQESDKKMKEWEGRWKQASTEAEQYKVAHGEATLAIDNLKSHVGTLELKLVESHEHLDTIQKEHQQVLQVHEQVNAEKENYINHISELEYELSTAKSLITSIQKEYEHVKTEHAHSAQKLQEFDASASDLQNQIQALSKQLEESKYYAGEWEGRFKEANNKLGQLTDHLEQTNSALTLAEQKENDQISLVAAKEKQIEELNAGLQFNRSALEKAQHAITDATNHSMEWETKYHEINTKFNAELSKAQQTIAASKSLADDWEVKYKDLTHKFDTLQLQLSDSHKHISRLEELSKKTGYDQEKYLVEVKAWQKRINELETEKTNVEHFSRERHAKEIEKHKKQIVHLLDEIADLKSNPKPPGNLITDSGNSLISDPDMVLSSSLAVTEQKEPLSKNRKTSGIVKLTNIKAVDSTIGLTIPSIDWKSGSITLGKRIKPNDHKIIEGIGPKINTLLKKANIKTWGQLSNTPIKDLRVILDKGGNKFSLADPTSWPAQAQLASMGEWFQLKKLQDNLTAGKSKKKVRSKSQKIKSRPLVKQKIKPLDLAKGTTILGSKVVLDDLKIVEGIGPKIEKLFHKANIRTWKALAESKTRSLQSILIKGGKRFSLANPGTWARQSKLAASGSWTRLKSLQDQLKGGN